MRALLAVLFVLASAPVAAAHLPVDVERSSSCSSWEGPSHHRTEKNGAWHESYSYDKVSSCDEHARWSATVDGPDGAPAAWARGESFASTFESEASGWRAYHDGDGCPDTGSTCTYDGTFEGGGENRQTHRREATHVGTSATGERRVHAAECETQDTTHGQRGWAAHTTMNGTYAGNSTYEERTRESRERCTEAWTLEGAWVGRACEREDVAYERTGTHAWKSHDTYGNSSLDNRTRSARADCFEGATVAQTVDGTGTDADGTAVEARAGRERRAAEECWGDAERADACEGAAADDAAVEVQGHGARGAWLGP